MKKHKHIVFFFFLSFSFTGFFSDTLTTVLGFGSNPGNLSLFYHAPKNAANLKNCPVVVVLHGCGQTANGVAELTGWNNLADQYGFYVLYPQQHFPNNPQHCFNWFKKNEIERGNGECESIKQMVYYMLNNFPTDGDRVFVTGLSAGAAMSVVMIATQPSLFKAAAIFAGGPYKPGSNIFSSSGSMIWGVNKTPDEWRELVWQQNPAFKDKYPKVIVYHGENDPVVNINNAKELVEQWTCLHKTDTLPDEVNEGYLDAKDVTRLAYKNKENEEVVIFYKIKDMGHAIPVNPGFCDNEGGRKAIFATDKNFYSTYYTACEFGLVPNWKIKGPNQLVAGEKNVLFSVMAKPDYTYEWQVPKDVEVTGSKTSNELKVNWGKEPGTINVIATGANTCRYYHSPIQANIK